MGDYRTEERIFELGPPAGRQRSTANFSCAFCPLRVWILVDAAGEPTGGLIHGYPSCRRFDELEALAFMAATNAADLMRETGAAARRADGGDPDKGDA